MTRGPLHPYPSLLLTLLLRIHHQHPPHARRWPQDVHLRRITHAVGSRSSSGRAPRLVVHFVEAGRIADFRAVEGFAEGRLIEEMPVHVADIFR